MSYRVCYVTTIAGTLDAFFLDSAKYNIEHGDWDITFISAGDELFEKKLPKKITFIPLNLQRGYTLIDLNDLFKLIQIMRSGKFDLVEYATTKAALYASIAARIARVPIRLYGQLGISYTTYSGVKRIVVKTIERIICSNSTNVYAVCKDNLDIAVEDGLYSREKGFVVGNGSSLGVDLERFDITKKQIWRKEIRNRYSINEGTFVFGYVGMLRKEKGINELLDAYRMIMNERSDTRLMIVGDDTLIEGVDKKKIDLARQSGNVVFTGKTDEVQKFFASFDCFVFPSYHEGFGNVTIEAEAMGIPIVATDIPGTRTAMIKDQTGIMVKKEDSEDLKKGMLALCDSAILRERLSQGGRQYVSEFYDRRKLCKWIYESRVQLLERKNERT